MEDGLGGKIGNQRLHFVKRSAANVSGVLDLEVCLGPPLDEAGDGGLEEATTLVLIWHAGFVDENERVLERKGCEGEKTCLYARKMYASVFLDKEGNVREARGHLSSGFGSMRSRGDILCVFCGNLCVRDGQRAMCFSFYMKW
jgi:hypothetical protein